MLREVLDVDRRDAAQRREGQVERLAGPRVEDRVQRHRRVADVGDQPDPVDRVEPARLGGDVGRRVVQAEERVEVLAPLLGDHLAVPVLRRSGRPSPGRSRSASRTSRASRSASSATVGAGRQPGHRAARGPVGQRGAVAVRPSVLDLDDHPLAGPVRPGRRRRRREPAAPAGSTRERRSARRPAPRAPGRRRRGRPARRGAARSRPRAATPSSAARVGRDHDDPRGRRRGRAARRAAGSRPGCGSAPGRRW